MRKVIAAFFAVILSFFGAMVVINAQDNGSVKQQFLAEREKFFELYGAESIDPESRAALKRYFGQAHDRIFAAILRLENISSRLKYIDGSNSNSRAGELLEEANAELLEARHGLETASYDFEHMFTYNDPQAAFRALRYSVAENINVKIADAHTKLGQAALLLHHE